jgi:uncharacterized membrane protein
MELAFVNAILNSPTFPPHDPWLSGYAISYYYFGYVLVAMLAKLVGTPGSIAFNIALGMVFALSAVGTYGLVYSLLAARHKPDAGSEAHPGLGLPLLGPLFVLVIGNLEGFLHVLHTRGLFWRQDATGALVSPFWKWLDIKELSLPPEQPFAWVPTKFWWWWRASRVVQDYDLAGNWKEIIDEFPAFSFILGDLHPHILAMPFAFVAVALALNLALGGAPGEINWLQRKMNLRTLAWSSVVLIGVGIALLWGALSNLSLRGLVLGSAGILAGGLLLAGILTPIGQHGLGVFTRSDIGERQVGFALQLKPIYLLLSAVVLGGMAFLNLWDIPIYIGVFAAAYVLGRLTAGYPSAADSQAASQGKPDISARHLAREFIGVMLLLGMGGLLLYLPFYLSFASQAGGVIPSLIYVTRGAHLWVMFGLLLLPLGMYLVWLWRTAGSRESLKKSGAIVLGFTLLLFALSLLLGVAISLIPGISDLFLGNFGAASLGEVLQAAFLRRLVSPGAWITLVALLLFTLALLLPRQGSGMKSPQFFLKPADGFALLLILFGGILVLGVEFFYLRDMFGSRMNTIFKFYFQTWLMWGVAAAFASAVLLRELPKGKGLLFSAFLSLLLIIGLFYPVLGLWSKTEGFLPSAGWSLDGSAYLARQNPDEITGIRWLSAAPAGVVAEAVGGSYSAYGRVATHSGQPNVLGWPGHESQWRGGANEMGSRENDLRTLYCTRSWDEAQIILDRYSIRYVFVGDLERSAYNPDTCGTGLSQDKFDRNMNTAFQQGNTTIYEVR